MLRFEDWFWGTPADPIAGINVLHEQYQMGIAQIEELQTLLSTREVAEDAYSAKLLEICATKPRADGFAKAEHSAPAQVFSHAKTGMAHLAATHQMMSGQLKALGGVLNMYLSDNRKESQTRKDIIDAELKSLISQKSELEVAEVEYRRACRAANEEQAKFERERGASGDVPGMEVMVTLGPRSFTVEDFNTLLSRMQRDIKTQDVKSLWTSAKNCFLGEDAVTYLRQKLHLDEEGALAMLSQLLAEHFLRSAGRVVGGGHATFRPQHHYQWKRLSIEDEPAHRKTRRLADRAGFEYRKCVDTAEQTRQQLEFHCWEYMNVLQTLETQRLHLFQASLKGLNQAEEVVAERTKEMCEQGGVYLETLNPTREVEMRVEALRTGNTHFDPILFKSAYGGSYKDPVFGVSLEEHASTRGRKVPTVIKKLLRAIEETRASGIEGTEIDWWLEPSSSIAAIHALRNDLNNPKSSPLKHLRRLPPSLLTNTLKLYLLELPISLCADDVYEPLKLLYLSKTDDFGPMRIASLRSLLATLSPAHYASLKTLSGYWHRRVVAALNEPEDPRINDLAQAWGHVVLRARVPTAVTLHDKHPVRLVKDLLMHHYEVFAAGSDSSEQPASRRETATSGPHASHLQPSLSSTNPSTNNQDDRRSFRSVRMSSDNDEDDHSESESRPPIRQNRPRRHRVPNLLSDDSADDDHPHGPSSSEDDDMDETASTRAIYDAASRVHTRLTSGASSVISTRTGHTSQTVVPHSGGIDTLSLLDRIVGSSDRDRDRRSVLSTMTSMTGMTTGTGGTAVYPAASGASGAANGGAGGGSGGWYAAQAAAAVERGVSSVGLGGLGGWFGRSSGQVPAPGVPASSSSTTAAQQPRSVTGGTASSPPSSSNPPAQQPPVPPKSQVTGSTASTSHILSPTTSITSIPNNHVSHEKQISSHSRTASTSDDELDLDVLISPEGIVTSRANSSELHIQIDQALNDHKSSEEAAKSPRLNKKKSRRSVTHEKQDLEEDDDIPQGIPRILPRVSSVHSSPVHSIASPLPDAPAPKIAQPKTETEAFRDEELEAEERDHEVGLLFFKVILLQKFDLFYPS
ncbi:hypothetical protein DFS34DRAFT_313807 [Phlyctochytrium arcticum]|nr:hypothetical protein DFS34DRAFT_640456 [Phlyctochytrium arcticum]KAI9091799.1 hypothetical protein DFS34DRAFT_313807 [Phlyctochytrium arcticum]